MHTLCPFIHYTGSTHDSASDCHPHIDTDRSTPTYLRQTDICTSTYLRESYMPTSYISQHVVLLVLAHDGDKHRLDPVAFDFRRSNHFGAPGWGTSRSSNNETNEHTCMVQQVSMRVHEWAWEAWLGTQAHVYGASSTRVVRQGW